MISLIKQNKNYKIDILLIIKLFFYSFPIILFLPSGYITAHVSLLTIISLLFIYKKKIKIKLHLVDYLIFALFFLSIISTLKNITTVGNLIFIKSVLDLRFAIFFLIVRNLLTNKIVNLKILSIITLISSILLSFDIFFQHIVGYDIFNFKPFDGRYNGFFEHEAIAGSYLQKNFLLSLISIFIIDVKKITKIIFLTILINIVGVATLLTLDRMPFIIFFFTIVILFFFIKKFRFHFFLNLIILSLIFAFFLKTYSIVNLRYVYLDKEINFNKIFKSTKNNNVVSVTNDKSNENQKLFHGNYSKLYYSAYQVILNNYLIGSGVKSFIYECIKLPSDNNISCNNHPHNLYLEILVNLGVVGFLIFIIFLYFIISEIIKLILKKNINENKKISLMLFLTFIIVELMPFRSYGSIFQTVNGSIFWFLLAIVSSKISLKN
jgi:O-antigen ligase